MILSVKCEIYLHIKTSKVKLEVLSYAIINFNEYLIITIHQAMRVLLNYIQPNAPNVMGEF